MELPQSISLKRMQWTAVILCAAAIAINYLDRSTIAIANPQIRAEFHMSAAQFGALQSAVLGAFCSGYGIWMYVTWLPGYLEGEHHISIARAGYLASIPLVCSMFGSFCGGYASDRLIARGMSIVLARKLPAALGHLGSALFTVFAALSTSPTAAILSISAAMFLLYFGVAAKWTLITAVSPQNFCSSCSSIQNCGSYLGGACSPLLTGLIVDWTGSFVMALAVGGVVMAVGAAIYYFLVQAPITDADLSHLSTSMPSS